MSGTVKFRRIFLILNSEDRGYEAGQAPSGYVRIEVRDGRGKLYGLVQNLRDGGGKYFYRLYLIAFEGGKAYPACACLIPVSEGKGEVRWQFDAGNVGGTGRGIDSFTVAAVLADTAGSDGSRIACPLAAYKSGRFEWRDAVRNALYPAKQPSAGREPGIAEDTGDTRAADDDIRVTDDTNAADDEMQAANDGIPAAVNEMQAADDDIRSEVDAADNDMIDADDITHAVDAESKYVPPESAPGFNIPESIRQQAPAPHEEAFGNPAGKEAVSGKECAYADRGLCTVNAGVNGQNPCSTCQMGAGPASTARNPEPLNMDKLKESFNRHFEKSDPFNSRRRDYRWWKVDNPVYLNNLMYQCGIRTPLLFNPMVMMAHFKYRHLIVGIYSDRIGRREYIVCGVPGVYNVDERPFGSMCRWVQLEGSRPRYGAFGYWLVYIDPSSGKFLNVN